MQRTFTAAIMDPAKLISHSFSDVSLMCPMAQALDAASNETREHVEDSTAVPATVKFPAKEQSSSSVRTIETGKINSEGKDMQIILVDFSETQEDLTLNSFRATIYF